MPPRNACFISFRNGTRELTRRFVRELHDGLSAELETQLGRGIGIFLDQERLQGGDFFNEIIAQDLCDSSCLVLVYTPSYFDLDHTYCAREYKAMLEMESRRFELLDGADQRLHGLIIPVIFRGTVPAEIGDVRHCYDFSDFLLAEGTMTKHRRYAPKLREIAEYIAERHRVISALENRNCADYRLPSTDSIRDWLAGVVPKPLGLPGRVNV